MFNFKTSESSFSNFFFADVLQAYSNWEKNLISWNPSFDQLDHEKNK